jgi:hypothetical protein
MAKRKAPKVDYDILYGSKLGLTKTPPNWEMPYFIRSPYGGAFAKTKAQANRILKVAKKGPPTGAMQKNPLSMVDLAIWGLWGYKMFVPGQVAPVPKPNVKANPLPNFFPKATSKGPFKISLGAGPNLDFGPGSPEAHVKVRKKLVPVPTIEVAQALVQQFIAKFDLGAGNWFAGPKDVGVIYKGKKKVARIAYNGRIFYPGDPNFVANPCGSKKKKKMKKNNPAQLSFYGVILHYPGEIKFVTKKGQGWGTTKSKTRAWAYSGTSMAEELVRQIHRGDITFPGVQYADVFLKKTESV